jgi:hypothetical protein
MIDLQTKTVQLGKGQAGDLPISVTVKEASVLQGMRREMLRMQAWRPAAKGSTDLVEEGSTDLVEEGSTDLVPAEQDEARQMVRMITYPDCMAGTVGYEGMEPPDFETFLALPAAIVNPWVAAVYELNPSWSGKSDDSKGKKQKK